MHWGCPLLASTHTHAQTAAQSRSSSGTSCAAAAAAGALAAGRVHRRRRRAAARGALAAMRGAHQQSYLGDELGALGGVRPRVVGRAVEALASCRRPRRAASPPPPLPPPFFPFPSSSSAAAADAASSRRPTPPLLLAAFPVLCTDASSSTVTSPSVNACQSSAPRTAGGALIGSLLPAARCESKRDSSDSTRRARGRRPPAGR